MGVKGRRRRGNGNACSGSRGCHHQSSLITSLITRSSPDPLMGFTDLHRACRFFPSRSPYPFLPHHLLFLTSELFLPSSLPSSPSFSPHCPLHHSPSSTPNIPSACLRERTKRCETVVSGATGSSLRTRVPSPSPPRLCGAGGISGPLTIRDRVLKGVWGRGRRRDVGVEVGRWWVAEGRSRWGEGKGNVFT